MASSSSSGSTSRRRRTSRPTSPSTRPRTTPSTRYLLSAETAQHAKAKFGVTLNQINTINTVYMYGAEFNIVEPYARESLIARNKTFFDLYEVINTSKQYGNPQM